MRQDLDALPEPPRAQRPRRHHRPRQEPAAVMIQDLRDPETARLAPQAALTGRLVLTSLHPSDAPSAAPRLIHLGVEPYLAASSLSGVLSQRLVRKLCQSCKETY